MNLVSDYHRNLPFRQQKYKLKFRLPLSYKRQTSSRRKQNLPAFHLVAILITPRDEKKMRLKRKVRDI